MINALNKEIFKVLEHLKCTIHLGESPVICPMFESPQKSTINTTAKKLGLQHELNKHTTVISQHRQISHRAAHSAVFTIHRAISLPRQRRALMKVQLARTL